MKRLAIVIREDAYDRLYTPLTFAYVAAKQGVEVDILFVLWAVRILTREGLDSARIHRLHKDDEQWFKDRLSANKVPIDLYEYLKVVKAAGHVSFHACELAAKTFGVAKYDLIPEAQGIVNSQWFLEEKAMKADHCQYF
ncbi:MAG: hypothetical protein GTO24_08315 [candidate division Zixibacteria bacterium]|nr:hypothetical protein [candidate division Zixibacteria bacterium]